LLLQIPSIFTISGKPFCQSFAFCRNRRWWWSTGNIGNSGKPAFSSFVWRLYEGRAVIGEQVVIPLDWVCPLGDIAAPGDNNSGSREHYRGGGPARSVFHLLNSCGNRRLRPWPAKLGFTIRFAPWAINTP
jgi:hypothetical protein